MKMQTWVSPLSPDFSDSVNLGGPRTCISNKFSGNTDATRPRTRNHTGEPLLHGSGLFVSTGFPSPGMSPPPPCTPQPILWALPVNTLPVKAEFSAVSSGQLFLVLPELLCLPPWDELVGHSARTHGAESAPGLGKMPRTPRRKSCGSSPWGHPIHVSHSQVLSWRLLDHENYVLWISTSAYEPRAHLDVS